MDNSIQDKKRIDKIYLYLAVSGLLGAILIIIGTSRYGPGITHDSAAYLYAADSLLSGNGLVYFGYGTPFVQWPPLLSLLLGFTSALGINAAAAARYINSAASGLIVFFTGVWLHKNIKNNALVLGGTALALISAPLIRVSEYIWTEPLFVLFTVLFILVMGNHIKSQKAVLLVMAGAFAGLACLTRYIGVTAVMAGGLLLLLQNKSFFKKGKDIFVFGFMGSTPLVVWMIRNYIAFSTLAGSRTASTSTLPQNMKVALNVIAAWFLPLGHLQGGMRQWAAVAFAAVVGLGFMAAVICGTRKYRKGNKEAVNSGAVTAAVFLAAYVVYLVGTASVVAFDTIDSRLMIPSYIPIVLIALYTIDYVYGIMGRPALRQMLAVLIALWLAYPLYSTYSLISSSVQEGAGGYSTEKWKASGLAYYIAQNPPGGKVYSNYPDVIYALTGVPSMYPPKKQTDVKEYSLDRFKEAVQEEGKAYLVWFNRGAANWFYNKEELGLYFSIEPVAGRDDGEVYILKLK